jgi:hypothetical protein
MIERRRRNRSWRHERSRRLGGAIIKALAALLPPPLGAPGPLALSGTGALEDLARPGGADPERTAEFTTRWEYSDRDTALPAHLASGPATRATRAIGEERVAAALSDASPFRTASGGYALENDRRHPVPTA